MASVSNAKGDRIEGLHSSLCVNSVKASDGEYRAQASRGRRLVVLVAVRQQPPVSLLLLVLLLTAVGSKPSLQ